MATHAGKNPIRCPAYNPARAEGEPTKIVDPTQFRQTPWRNGGGSTEELWVQPDPAGGDFLWRLSIATIEQSGPFSQFVGYDRIIVPLSGGAITLQHADDKVRPLTQLIPYEFSGDLATTCELHGETARDFNVIVRRDYGRAAVNLIRGQNNMPIDDPSLVAIWVAEGTLEVSAQTLGTKTPRSLPPHTLLLPCREPFAATTSQGSIMFMILIKKRKN